MKIFLFIGAAWLAWIAIRLIITLIVVAVNND